MNISYKCKACGSSMEYDAGTDSLVCVHCGSREKVADLEREQKEDDRRIRPAASGKRQDGSQERSGEWPPEDSSEPAGSWFAKTDGGDEAEDAALGIGSEETLSLYACPNCGAQLMADQYTAATVCAYCGSPVVLQERVSREAAPDYVVPFKIGKKEAKEIYRKWTKSGFFTPRVFSSESVLDSITGTYVPYWLYDFGIHMELSAAATRVETRRSAKKETVYTHHYHVEREVEMAFEQIPADASERMPDEIMEKLEPFSYDELDEFRMPYLSGYMAECVNGPSEAYSSRAIDRARDAAVVAAKNSIKGYATVTVLRESHEVHDLKSAYAMMPVWVLNYRYRDRNWQLFLNGQTGKKIGSLPVNKVKAALTFLGLSGALTGIAMAVFQFVLR